MGGPSSLLSATLCTKQLRACLPRRSPAGIHVELYQLLTDKWRWLAGIWSRRYIGANKLDALMKDWAGVEEEEAALAAAEAQAAAAVGAAAGEEGSNDDERVLQVGAMACTLGWLPNPCVVLHWHILNCIFGAAQCNRIHYVLVVLHAVCLIDYWCMCRCLQVAGETVDEATLTQVLLAVLDQPDDPKTAQTQGVAVSEVEAAAHYIVKRFGKSARKAAEQALQEVGGPDWLCNSATGLH
jgi:uncharacterized membrane protein YuzA (DUF378 family)